MNKTVLQQILEQYGLPASVVLSTEKGYRNESHPLILPDGQKVNLILYKSEPGILQKIQDANRVSNYLSKRGFPARRTVDDRIIQLRAGDRLQYGALYYYLPGVTIPWEAYTMAHIKLLGKTMSDMHMALQALPKPATTNVADEHLSIVGRMQRYFADEQVRKAIQEKLGLAISDRVFTQLEKIIRICRDLPDQQTLHMDFVRGNILFSKDPEPGITGILDFEKTACGSPLFDIARTFAFLLVDCKYKPSEKIRKYFLASGYNKKRARKFKNYQLDDHETLLDALTELFLIYDFYKFLRHNPYESLHANEHFVRTRNLLQRYGIIELT
jgi:Ser/Thr protein kinase RdoA (MazF antagonist)